MVKYLGNCCSPYCSLSKSASSIQKTLMISFKNNGEFHLSRCFRCKAMLTGEDGLKNLSSQIDKFKLSDYYITHNQEINM